MMDARAQEVLDFWFGSPGSPEHGQTRALWFTKRDDTDALIRTRFGALIEEALSGALDDWTRSGPSAPRGALALIVLLDQFTRNAFATRRTHLPVMGGRWQWPPRWSTPGRTARWRCSNASSSTCRSSTPSLCRCRSEL
jgi:hypothetical protein